MTNRAGTIQSIREEGASLAADGLRQGPPPPAKYSLVVGLASLAAATVWGFIALGVSHSDWNTDSALIPMALFLLPIVAIATGAIGLSSARRTPEGSPMSRTRCVAAVFAAIGLAVGVLGTAGLVFVSVGVMSAF